MNRVPRLMSTSSFDRDAFARRQALLRGDLPTSHVLDRLARLASRILRAPVAQVNLVTSDSQVSLSSVGPGSWSGPREVPLELSYCQHAVATGEPLLVEDAREHPRVRENRATTESGIVAYAGVPLVHPQGGPVGTLCVVDFQTRAWTDEEVDLLLDLASAAMAEIELREEVRDRRRAERLLQESQERVQQIAESIREVFWMTDADGTSVLYVSPAFEELWGRSTESLYADFRVWVEGIHPADRERVLAAYTPEKLVAGGFDEEYRIVRPDGEIRWVHDRGFPVRDENGVVYRLAGVADDITERRRAEEALRAAHEELESRVLERTVELRESESRYRQMFERNGAVKLLIDPLDGRIVDANPAARSFYGYPAGEWGEKRITDINALPEAQVRAEMSRALEEARSYFVFPHRLASGEIRTVEVHSGPIEVQGRTLLYSIIHDITERERAEEALRRSEERFRATFEQAAVGMAQVGPDGRWLWVNQRLCEIVGYSREELLRLTFRDLTHPDDREGDLQELERMRTGEVQAYRREKRYLHREGHPVWVLVTVSLVWDGSGELEHSVAVVEDISTRKEAEAAVVRTAEHFRSLIEKASDIIILLDREGMIRYGSPAVRRELGYEPGELLGRSVFDFVHPDDLPGVLQALATLVQAPGGTLAVDMRFRHVSGEWRVLEATGSNLLETEAVGAVVVNCRDVTERRATEEALRESREQLFQSQKMEAVGRLAGGMAHDFNNMLAVIKAVTQMLLQDVGEESPLQADLQEVDEAATRAAALTRQLLAFSRRQVLQPRVLDLNRVVADTEKMLRRLVGEDVKLERAFAPGLRRVLADPGQMEQVVVNLVVNARDAMPEGGTIVLSTRNLEVPPGGEGLPAGVRPGSYVLLAVRDTGVGMDEATRARAFEPFFTTKEEGRGTGLGLSTVYGIVAQSGGHVWVESEPGAGTVVRILLPSAAAEEAPPVEPAGRSASPGGETILLVEDDSAVRKSVRRLLERIGYTVLEAANGEQAIERMESDPEAVDLLLTDVVMPGMSGPDLVKRLSGMRPGLRVLYMSGYTEDAAMLRRLAESRITLVEKPFTLDGLSRKVREALQ